MQTINLKEPEEVHIVLIEPKSTRNTGNIVTERTVAQLERT